MKLLLKAFQICVSISPTVCIFIWLAHVSEIRSRKTCVPEICLFGITSLVAELFWHMSRSPKQNGHNVINGMDFGRIPKGFCTPESKKSRGFWHSGPLNSETSPEIDEIVILQS